MTNFSMNTSTLLKRYDDRYVESVLMIKLTRDVSVNGTLLECSMAETISDREYVLIELPGMCMY